MVLEEPTPGSVEVSFKMQMPTYVARGIQVAMLFAAHKWCGGFSGVLGRRSTWCFGVQPVPMNVQAPKPGNAVGSLYGKEIRPTHFVDVTARFRSGNTVKTSLGTPQSACAPEDWRILRIEYGYYDENVHGGREKQKVYCSLEGRDLYDLSLELGLNPVRDLIVDVLNTTMPERSAEMRPGYYGYVLCFPSGETVRHQVEYRRHGHSVAVVPPVPHDLASLIGERIRG